MYKCQAMFSHPATYQTKSKALQQASPPLPSHLFSQTSQTTMNFLILTLTTLLATALAAPAHDVSAALDARQKDCGLPGGKSFDIT
jgi:hypothetical protein